MNINANLIPEFIADKFKEHKFKGTIKGTVLFCDISGFTILTETLFVAGKSGAEQLSDIMTGLFSFMSDSVYHNHGFIANFAGDAFTAIFPDDNGLNACFTAEYIRRFFPKSIDLHNEEFPIAVKSGISFGDIEWYIFGNSPYSYVFKGKPVNNAAKNEHKADADTIIIDSSVLQTAEQNGFVINEGNDIISIADYNGDIEVITPVKEIISNELQSKFLHKDIIDKINSPEIRNILPVFVSFKDNTTFSNEHYINSIREIARKYGGYFNLLDYGDKGNIIFILFGAPLTHEGITIHAVDSLNEIRKLFGSSIKAGITHGRAYTGYIGSEYRGTYTAIGDKVNIAARFMQNADWGSIWISEDIGRTISTVYMIEYMGNMEFKGKSANIHFYKLLEPVSRTVEFNYENIFVGREAELNKLRKMFNNLVNNNIKNIAYINGDAGIGKTRLFYEAQKECISHCHTVYIKCDEVLRKSLNPIEYFFTNIFNIQQSNNSSYKTFSDAFHSFIDSIDDSSDLSESLKAQLRDNMHIISGFLNIENNEAYYNLDAKARFDNIVLTFSNTISLMSLMKPIILVMDDIQWLDEDTSSILNKFITQISNYPVSIVFLSRDALEMSNIEETLNNFSIINMNLESLNDDDTEILIEKELPYPPNRDLLMLIKSKTEGNPFYIEQICLFLMEKDFISFRDNVSVLRNADIDLPQGISGVIISRIDSLSHNLKETIHHASVLGRNFNKNILSRMLRQSIDASLLEGQNEKIWNSLSSIQYIFRHTLIRDTAYEMQLEKRLKDIHALAADIMEDDYGNDEHFYSDLSYHYFKAGNNDKMLPYTEKAIKYAIENYRNEEALVLIRRYIDTTTDIDKKMRMIMKIGEVYEVQAKWKEAIELYRAPLDYFQNRDPLLYADCLNRTGFIKHRLGEHEEAIKIHNTTLIMYEELDYHVGIAGSINNIAIAYMALNESKKAMKYLIRTLDFLKDRMETKELKKIYMYAENNLGLLNLRLGNIDTAEENFNESIAISDMIHEKRSIAYLNLGNVMYLKNRIDDAEKQYNLAMKNAIAVGDRHVARVLMNNIGSIYTMKHEYEKAQKQYLDALKIAEELGDRDGMRVLNNNLGDIAMYLGKFDIAMDYFKIALNIAVDTGDIRAQGSVNGCIGILEFWNGNYIIAEEKISKAIKLTRESNHLSYTLQFIYYMILIQLKMNNNEYAQKLFEEFNSIPDKFLNINEKWYRPFIEAKLESLINKDNAVKIYSDIILQYKGMEAEARSLKELFFITGNDEYRIKYIKAFTDLHNKDPRFDYLLEMND